MFNKLFLWLNKNSIPVLVTIALLTCLIAIINLVDIVRKPASINIAEGGIQHHLVWSNKGECYFVRPYSSDVVYLIRVQDCDKK
jgi:hypothetical protein